MAKRRTPVKTKAIVKSPPPAPRLTRIVRARYDAAQTNDENRRHWANADALAPDDSTNPAVRQALRNRGRYVYANNSYCKGIIDTLATDCVGGSGPRLQMQTDDEGLNDRIEEDFTFWAQEVDLAEKLRTMRAGRAHSGEAFGLMATNIALVPDVKMDLTLVEPDMVTDPFVPLPEPTVAEGIEFDGQGNPTAYRVLKSHPGSTAGMAFFGADDFQRWPAKFVLHYFKPDRPGQHRGVPDIAPAVQLIEELRRYRAAVLGAAETAADFAAVLQSEQPDVPPVGNGDATDSNMPAVMDTIELARRMGTVLPPGYKLGQIHAEQPVTTYDTFVDKILEEFARCVGMPWTIAALNSSKANMSASYLDGQRYANTVAVERARLECHLNRLLDVWLTEWIGVNQVTGLPPRLVRQWFWPSLGYHADPGKVASARTEALKNGTTTIPLECAKEGRDWEQDQASAAKSLGLTVEQYREKLLQGIYGPTPAPPAGPAPKSSNAQEDTADANANAE